MTTLKRLTTVMATLAVLVLCAGTALAISIPIPNADFESGNTGFTSAYFYHALGAGDPASGYNPGCVPGTCTLYDEGTYSVGLSPSAYHTNPNWASFGDHTTGSGQMMIVNGDNTANVQVWAVPVAGSIAVTANTQYYFAAWLTSVDPFTVGSAPTSPAVLAFSINGSQIGSDFSLSTGTVGNWQLFYQGWFSGAATTATLSLINRNLVANGNDFALDDISLQTEIPGVIPEPTSLLLLGTGLVGLTVAGWRRKKA